MTLLPDEGHLADAEAQATTERIDDIAVADELARERRAARRRGPAAAEGLPPPEGGLTAVGRSQRAVRDHGFPV